MSSNEFINEYEKLTYAEVHKLPLEMQELYEMHYVVTRQLDMTLTTDQCEFKDVVPLDWVYEKLDWSLGVVTVHADCTICIRKWGLKKRSQSHPRLDISISRKK